MPDSPLIIRSKKRRRTVALQVRSDGRITVQAPASVSASWIQRFITSRGDWISKRRKELAEKRAQRNERLCDGASVPFLGKKLSLKIIRKSHADPVREEDVLRLSLPATLSPRALKEEIRTELILWYKKQARRHFQRRVSHWSEKMELTPSKVLISAPKQQWGSCSGTNEIRLNWHLILAEPKLLDYILVHELAHIRHKHHGPAFWRCVERQIPDYKERRKTLGDWEVPFWLSEGPSDSL